MYSSQGLKAKKVKIKADVTIGPERRRSRKFRLVKQSLNAAATPTVTLLIIITLNNIDWPKQNWTILEVCNLCL